MPEGRQFLLLNPMVEDEATWRQTMERANRGWWMILLGGVASIIVGVFVLSIDWTLGDLAVFVGAYLIFRGYFRRSTPRWEERVGATT